jgi:LemA protein
MTDTTTAAPRGSIFTNTKFWIAAVAILFIVAWGISRANGFVTLDEDVKTATGKVQIQLQRQYELIPNMAETVKSYAQFEQDTFRDVAAARSRAGGVINVDPAKIAADPALQKQMMDSMNSLGGTIGRLLMLQEKYPELKADKGYQDLRIVLEGSQNRVATERVRLQTAVRIYNVETRRFPGAVMASVLGYKQKEYFGADTDAQKAPKLDMRLNSSTK